MNESPLPSTAFALPVDSVRYRIRKSPPRSMQIASSHLSQPAERSKWSRAGVPVLCLALVAGLPGCGTRDSGSGGGSGDSLLPPIGGDSDIEYRQPPLSCGFDDMKSWVRDGMLDYYLFADQVDPNVDPGPYQSLNTLIRDLRVAPNDTFSYVTDEQSHSDRFTEGETVGLGWLLHRDSDDRMTFQLVEPGSPLAAAGVQRGERLVSINDVPAADFFRQASSERDDLLDNEENGATARLTVESVLGVTRSFMVSKARYALQTVLGTEVFERNGQRIAWLHFYQFLNTSSAELSDAFDALQARNVSELVLDLRYNFGGRVSVATELASYIAGREQAGEPFVIYQANARYRDEHSTAFDFVDRAQALNLNRVFILQTGDTCSASELVINGLRPYMDVITIGESSCGKPYASIPNTACGEVMNALELEAVNAAGAGAYYQGIAADCNAIDDPNQTLGSPSENLLASALSYIDTGSCDASATRRAAAATVSQPAVLRPSWFGLSEL